MATLASIILPTYNRSYRLAQTIDSVLSQTYALFEIIVLDDGSTDGTPELVSRRFGSDPRVCYCRRVNGGVSAARNAALALARGEIVAFCDSDDLCIGDKLMLQMAVFERFSDVNLVWIDVSAVNPDGHVLHERYTRICYPPWHSRPIEEIFQFSTQLDECLSEPIAHLAGVRVHVGNILPTMLEGTVINMPSVAVRARLIEKIGNFDESMRAGEDYDFNLRACEAGLVAFIDSPTVFYRIGAADQLTRPSLNVEQARNWFRSVYRLMADRNAKDPVEFSPRRMRALLVDKYAWLGLSELDCGDCVAARAAFVAKRPLRFSLRADLAISLHFVVAAGCG